MSRCIIIFCFLKNSYTQVNIYYTLINIAQFLKGENMKDTSKNNENNRKNAKNTVMNTEKKDKIDFSFVIQDRLL